MKKILLTFVMFILLTNLANAQPSKFKLELNYTELGLIQTGNYKIDSIIDNRVVKDNWGVVMTGLSNRKTAVELEYGIAALKFYLDNSIYSDEKAQHLTLVLNNLWLNEQIAGFKEVATCELEMLICKKDKDNNLRIIDDVSLEVEGSSAIADLTKSSSKRVKEVFQNAFNQLTSEKIANEKAELYVSKPLILSNCIIFKRDSLKIGFFKNFNDLYNNEATLIPNADIQNTLGNETYKIIDTNTGKRMKRLYAFS